MAVLYILAGINHFVNARFYIRIIPPYIPRPELMNVLSGVAEILLGILLLIPAFSSIAAWGIIALLIAVFPANIYHYTSAKAGKGIPRWILLVRLPMQGLLVYWAWLYTA